jgi:hypothetical protein
MKLAQVELRSGRVEDPAAAMSTVFNTAAASCVSSNEPARASAASTAMRSRAVIKGHPDIIGSTMWMETWRAHDMAE